MDLSLLLEKMGRAATVAGKYKTWKEDPHPYYLVLGYYVNHLKHKLMAAINLNYVYSKFGENGIKTIKKHLPQILRYTDQFKGGQPRKLDGLNGRYWTARGIADPVLQYIMINFYRSPNIENFGAIKRGFMSFDMPEKPELVEPKPKIEPKKIGIEEFKEKSVREVAEMVEQHQTETGAPPKLETPEVKEPEKERPPLKAPKEIKRPAMQPLGISPLPGLEPVEKKPIQEPQPAQEPQKKPMQPKKKLPPPKNPFRDRLKAALADIERGKTQEADQTKQEASDKASSDIDRNRKGPANQKIIMPPIEEPEI